MERRLEAAAAASGKLFRNPDDPFEAFDEFGQPVLPMTIGNGSPSSGNSAAPNGVDLQTGRMTAAVLAPRLHWRTVLANAHAQRWVSYRDLHAPIDINIASVIEAMWQADFVTLACCEGDQTDTETGYVMFSEEIGKRFMEWAQAREGHLPESLMRNFDILLQDGEWRSFMGARYPLLQPVEPDVEGRLFTLCWRFHRQELLDHRDQLVRLLRSNLQEPSCSIRQ